MDFIGADLTVPFSSVIPSEARDPSDFVLGMTSRNADRIPGCAEPQRF
jgi:hypothetical protein